MSTTLVEKEITGKYTGGFDSPFRFSGSQEAIGAKAQSGKYEHVPTYPRNGSGALFQLERAVSRLVDAEGSHFYYVNSGMSSLVVATELTSPTRNDTLILGPTVYGRSRQYFDQIIGGRGAKTSKLSSVKPSDIEDQLRLVISANPGSEVKAVLIETIGNGLGMPVADPEAIMSLKIWGEIEELKDTLLIFDNTLSAGVVPLASILRANPEIRAVQADSATKFIEQNKALGGFIFSYNDAIGEKLWTYRTVLGQTPDAKAAQASLRRIPKTPNEYEEYILTASANTARLAKGIEEVADGRLRVSYPGLDSHPDHELARKWHPRGAIAPVLFFAPVPAAALTVEELYYRLEQSGGFKKIQHSDSFGFKRAGVYYNNSDPSLRIAGGQETVEIVDKQIDQIQKALRRVLRS